MLLQTHRQDFQSIVPLEWWKTYKQRHKNLQLAKENLSISLTQNLTIRLNSDLRSSVLNSSHLPTICPPLIREAIDDTPAILIYGPRQCGKTTLALTIGKESDHHYLSFDDEIVRAGAKEDPIGFVHDLPDRIILDEVQHVPEIFSRLKLAIDRRRVPGRFILTGSTNILLLPALSDSLAGRMEVLHLHPPAQCELTKTPSTFLQRLFSNQFDSVSVSRLGDELIERIDAGGYHATLQRTSARRRDIWYRDHLETLIQRDIRDLARISSLDVMPRLITGVASQTHEHQRSSFTISDKSPDRKRLCNAVETCFSSG